MIGRPRFLGHATNSSRARPGTKNPAILALSSGSWLNYTRQNMMDYAWSFSAELSPEGLIGISGSLLR